jgi:DMSO/TMAO reductase YedYZ molybdopterin-dependent catalytic subunit
VPRRLTNLVLLAAVAALLATGVVAWLLPETVSAPLYLAHRVAGLGLVAALVSKYPIARRSLRRRGPTASVWLGATTAVLAIGATALGLAWTAGLVSFDRPIAYSALSLHIAAGLGLGALVVAHALLRGESRPPLVTLASRRAALRGIGLLAVAFAATAALDRLSPARRVTGSRHAGSFTGNAYPVTIWSLDTVPVIDPASWRLTVRRATGAAPAMLRYADLAELPRREASVVLDCTGGWWTEQLWSGVGLHDLLARAGVGEDATRVEVISVTGHRWTFDRSESERAILATHVGGEALDAGHGFPVRLVAPGLRGFLWIKWVGEVVAA